MADLTHLRHSGSTEVDSEFLKPTLHRVLAQWIDSVTSGSCFALIK